MARSFLQNMLGFNRDMSDWYNRTFGVTASLDPRKKYKLLFNPEEASKFVDTTNAQPATFSHPSESLQATQMFNQARDQFLQLSQPNYIPQQFQQLPVEQNVFYQFDASSVSPYVGNPYDVAYQQAADRYLQSQEQYRQFEQQRSNTVPFYRKPIEQFDAYDWQMAYRYAGGIPEETKRYRPEEAAAIEQWLANNRQALNNAYMQRQYPGIRQATPVPAQQEIRQPSIQNNRLAARPEVVEELNKKTMAFDQQRRQMKEYSRTQRTAQLQEQQRAREQLARYAQGTVSMPDYRYVSPNLMTGGEEVRQAKLASKHGNTNDVMFWNWRSTNLDLVPGMSVAQKFQDYFNTRPEYRAAKYQQDPNLQYFANRYFRPFIALNNFSNFFGVVPNIEAVLRRAYEMHKANPKKWALDDVRLYIDAAADVHLPKTRESAEKYDQFLATFYSGRPLA
ncbi:MAG: hypothetical protein KatS3mg087_1044 [Patescibacteria group bacterium]|nr:MAG: hypothetical protein KatS3mg087_1044 [Patescibacteria group bacterium]